MKAYESVRRKKKVEMNFVLRRQSDGREFVAYFIWSASKTFYISFRYMTVTDN